MPTTEETEDEEKDVQMLKGVTKTVAQSVAAKKRSSSRMTVVDTQKEKIVSL